MIFHLSTNGHWSQFNANRNLQFRVRWLRKLYSVQIAQFWYTTTVRTAWLWNSSIVLKLNYEASQLCNISAVMKPWGKAPFWFDSSALISSTHSALLCTHLLHSFSRALFCSVSICSALPCSALPVLFCSGLARHLQYFIFPDKDVQSSVFHWNGKCFLN